jgi:hypothetical protein
MHQSATVLDKLFFPVEAILRNQALLPTFQADRDFILVILQNAVQHLGNLVDEADASLEYRMCDLLRLETSQETAVVNSCRANIGLSGPTATRAQACRAQVTKDAIGCVVRRDIVHLFKAFAEQLLDQQRKHFCFTRAGFVRTYPGQPIREGLRLQDFSTLDQAIRVTLPIPAGVLINLSIEDFPTAAIAGAKAGAKPSLR